MINPSEPQWSSAITFAPSFLHSSPPPPHLLCFSLTLSYQWATLRSELTSHSSGFNAQLWLGCILSACETRCQCFCRICSMFREVLSALCVASKIDLSAGQEPHRGQGCCPTAPVNPGTQNRNYNSLPSDRQTQRKTRMALSGAHTSGNSSLWKPHLNLQGPDFCFDLPQTAHTCRYQSHECVW